MSKENVELARRALDSFNRRDLAAYLELMDADVEFVAGASRWRATITATLESAAFGGTSSTSCPDLTVEAIELRDLGDRTLGAARIRGHGAGSDTPFDEPFWGIAEWRQGKCVRWAFGTEAEAIEAAGLRE